MNTVVSKPGGKVHCLQMVGHWFTGRGMAQVISCQTPAAEAWVHPRPAYVGCVVDTGAPRQVSLSTSIFSCIIPPMFYTKSFIYHQYHTILAADSINK